jgi:hypothetical protein
MSTKKKEKDKQSGIEGGFERFKKALPIKLNKKQFFAVLSLLIIITVYLYRSIFFVAFVNGIPITRYEFNKEMERSVGKQTLDGLVSKKLVMQEIARHGVVVSQEDINTEIESVTQIVEEQGGSLDQALALQGQTREDFEENIRLQKSIEILLKDKITITDQEVNDYFEENSEYFEEGTKLEDVNQDVRQQLLSQKLSSEYGNWIDEIKESSNIIYFLKY